MTNLYIFIPFVLTILGFIIIYFEKKDDKQKLAYFDTVYEKLISEIKPNISDFSGLRHIKVNYINVISSFLYRYNNMLFNEYKNFTYKKIYSIRNGNVKILANAYKSKNFVEIYDAMSIMSDSVMKKSPDEVYYSKNDFSRDLLNISRLLKEGKIRESRIIFYEISKKENTDSDTMWIAFLLRCWSAELIKGIDEETKKNLSFIFSKWIEYLIKSIDKNDKISTLKFLDYLYVDIAKFETKMKVDLLT